MPITPVGGPNLDNTVTPLSQIQKQARENNVEENPNVRAQEQRQADRSQNKRSENRVVGVQQADEKNKKGLEQMAQDGHANDNLGKALDIKA